MDNEPKKVLELFCCSELRNLTLMETFRKCASHKAQIPWLGSAKREFWLAWLDGWISFVADSLNFIFAKSALQSHDLTCCLENDTESHRLCLSCIAAREYTQRSTIWESDLRKAVLTNMVAIWLLEYSVARTLPQSTRVEPSYMQQEDIESQSDPSTETILTS